MINVLTLVKKNFLIEKKNIIFLILGAVILPIFLQNSLKGYSNSFLPYFLASLFILYLVQNTVSSIEFKYKGEAFLTMTPYTRKDIINSKYIFVFVTFLVCLVLYIIVSFVAPSHLRMITIETVLSTLFIETLFFGIYIPLEIFLGYDKIRYVFMLLVVSTPWTLVSFLEFFPNFNFSFLKSMKFIYLELLAVLLIIMITIVSKKVSMLLYSKKDL